MLYRRMVLTLCLAATVLLSSSIGGAAFVPGPPRSVQKHKSSPATAAAFSGRGRSHITRYSSALPILEEVDKLLESSWIKDVPQSLDEITSEAQDSLADALNSTEKRFRIDICTPGLDDQFEQTAIRDKCLTLGVLGAFLPYLTGYRAKVLFQSEGDAAMATKAYSRGDWMIPDSVTFAGLNARSVSPDDEVLFLVEPANRPGDPVILKVEEIIDKFPDMKIVMFNPDLELKGSAPGIRERDRRQKLLDSFKSAYMYIALASLSRPALIPRELGALHYKLGGTFRILRCLLPEDGPGSLNRLMKRRVYETTPDTPTAAKPPRFFLLEEYENRPKAEDLAYAMSRAGDVLESLVNQRKKAVESTEEARGILIQAARTRDVDPARVTNAIIFLEKVGRKGGKKGAEEEQQEAKELSKVMDGEWRLIFTTGTKSTQRAVGNINYFPVKAKHIFNSATGDYSNNVYLGTWPAVQVLGKFSCPKKKSLEFVVEGIKLGPFPVPFKGDGFFNFWFVDNAIAVARGQGGGLALWAKEEQL